MNAETLYLTASDDQRIAIHRWLPEEPPRGLILISHGMAEYAMRYDRFAEAAVGDGYAVFAPDHRGHGETAGSLSKLGYLADENGFTRVMEDLHEITLEMKKQFPNLPIVLLGHSFGSFVSQLYIETFGDLLSGCVLSGTRGPDPFQVVGAQIVAAIVGFFCGRKKVSPFLSQLSFGSNNDRITDPQSPNAWLSRDEAEVEKYDASPWAGFTCTVGFFQDLTKGLSAIHNKQNLRNIPKALPIYVVWGSDDPVGGYGKTVSRLVDLYAGLGVQDLTFKVYQGCRHEILNETNRDEVSADILAWIAGHTLR
jgi:alpha-beta hydrolase superfamily lysophospholipase